MAEDFSQLTQRAIVAQKREEAGRDERQAEQAARAADEFEVAVGLFESQLRECAAELCRLGVKPVKLYDWKAEKRRKWWELPVLLPGGQRPSRLTVEHKLRFWSTTYSGGKPGGVPLRNSARHLPSWSDGERDTPTRETLTEVNEGVEGGLELVTYTWLHKERLGSVPLRDALAEGVAALALEHSRKE